ncbi:Uma2 family endonuclease [Microcoleus sp. LEGE 07076]|uniref:Uma2 family endonuclease n=1 Tax=Microcoleus sp. LEGE 07076 TaxID=915322 RepID=UPI00187EFBDB|nr:Uma2 family endonuclease [Microcoleus sp. LEGE 07076]MBE9183554.1 Uma2 family endonuclease [Microcoleus sp. LEGE 07076]
MTQTAVKNSITDSCLTLRGVSWSQFESLEAAFESVGGIKFAYLDGILEIMTVSPEHEESKSTIGLLLEAYLREKGIRFYVKGGPTLGSKELGARKEPDESYNLQTKKAIPDLAIEVVFTSGGIDKLQLYKRLGIPEVWFWEDGVLSIYYLKEEYEKVDRSELLPELDIALLVRYVTYFDQYDAVNEFIKALRE